MNLADAEKLKSKCRYIQNVISELESNFKQISLAQIYQQIKLSEHQQKTLNSIADQANLEIQDLIQHGQQYEKQCAIIKATHEQYIIRKNNLEKQIQKSKQSIQESKFKVKRNSKKFMQIQILQQEIAKERKLNNKHMKHYNQILNQNCQIQQAIERLERKQNYFEKQKILMSKYEQQNKQNSALEQKYQELIEEKSKLCSQLGFIDNTYRLQTQKIIKELQQRQANTLQIQSEYQLINSKINKQTKLIQQISKREKIVGAANYSLQFPKPEIRQLAKPINFLPQTKLNKLNEQIIVSIKKPQKYIPIKKRKNSNFHIKRNSLFVPVHNLSGNFETQKSLSKQQKKTVAMIAQKSIQKPMVDIEDDNNVLPSVIAKKQKQEIRNKYEKTKDSNSNSFKFELTNSNKKCVTYNDQTNVTPHRRKYNTSRKLNLQNQSKHRINLTEHLSQKPKRPQIKMTIRDRLGNRKQGVSDHQMSLFSSTSLKRPKIQHVHTEGIVNIYQNLLDSKCKPQYEDRVNKAVNSFKNMVYLNNATLFYKDQEQNSYKLTQRTLQSKKKGKNTLKGMNFQRQSDSSSTQEVVTNNNMFTIRQNQQEEKINTIDQASRILN